MQSDSARAILRQATMSRTKQPDGLQPWRVAEHPDWLSRSEATEKGQAVMGRVKDDDDDLEESNGPGLENDVPKILDGFKEAHPEITVEHDEKAKVIKVYSHDCVMLS